MNPAPMTLLSNGVPLSLLIDLVFGPDSEDLLLHETLRDSLPGPRDSGE